MTSMTNTGTTPGAPASAVETLDVSGTTPIPLSRLIRIEMRKMADTRAGMWLLISIGAIGALVTAGFFIWGESKDRTFFTLMGFGGVPLGVLLPVLGILLITQEWGQRTALVTFTQVPHRHRVLVSKAVAAVLFGLAGFVVIGLVAAVLAPLGGAPEPFGDVSAGILLRVLLGLEIGIVWGLAFGAALLNSAFAIVLYFLVPTIVSVIGGIWSSVSDKLVWIDLNQSQEPLFDSGGVSGTEWAHLATGVLVWVVIPGVIGIWRVLRSEVK